MEIKIELDMEQVESNYLVISDRGFDSPDNWISLKLINQQGNSEHIGDVRLNDFLPALIAFDAKYSRQQDLS